MMWVSMKTAGSECLLDPFADAFEHVDKVPEALGADVRKLPCGPRADGAVDRFEQPQTLLRNTRANDAPIVIGTRPLDQVPPLEAIHQPRNVGILRQQPVAHLPTGHARLACAAQDPQRVV